MGRYASQSPDTPSKRLQLLQEVVPGLRRLAILANVNWRGAVQEMDQVQTVAPTLGLDVVDKLELRSADDIAPAFAGIKGGAQALYVSSDPLVAATRRSTADELRAPRIHRIGRPNGLWAEFLDLNRRSGDFVDRILRGAKPADIIPVEQPTKFDLIFNLGTAKALGLNIPESLLLRADEVIE